MGALFSFFPSYIKDDAAEAVTDLIALSMIFLFIAGYFRPEYLLSRTITTGGDTASHYFTAQYLRDYLLPRGKISGWCPGNLAGFPMLQNYFPLPFFLMAIVSWVIPLEISFKLVTVMGTFFLPVCAYIFFRLLRMPFPVPALGAAFTLPFLFNQGNSMWGGNIPSTLAGTFCYGLGFSLSVLWLGLMYRTFSAKRGIVAPSVLLALVGLCHGYTLLFCLFASLYFLVGFQGFRENLKRLILIHTLSFCLMAFWLLPLLAFLPYTTRFSFVWIFFGWAQIQKEILPGIFFPFIGLAVAGLLCLIVARFLRGRFPVAPSIAAYLWFLSAAGLMLYGIGYKIGLVDIRFLPFFQLFLVLAGATLFALPRLPLAARGLLCGLGLVGTLLWVDSRVTFIENWIRANYQGFEAARQWEPFSAVNRSIQGSPGDPRVVYEHSPVNGGAGTVRAFESIPLFSGRSTLEGVYIQGSLSVPFIFYLQSEISQKPSTPLADYNYSRFDLKRAVDHLKMFNVSELILVEPESKAAAAANPEFRLLGSFEPFELWELRSNSNRYVEPLKYRPVAWVTRDFRETAYQWFRMGDLEVPLVFQDRPEDKDPHRFEVIEDADIRNLPRAPVEGSPAIRETVKEEEILIEGAAVGKPLMVKVSYHPNWKVEGADRIYIVSPAFMLIYPSSSRVRLYYGRTWPDYAGAVLTVAALLAIVLSRFRRFSSLRRTADSWFSRWGIRLAVVGMAIVGVAFIYFILRVSPDYPVLSYNRGMDAFKQQSYAEARSWFQEVLERHPQSMLVDQAAYHHAMAYFRENDWENTIRSLEWTLETYPETTRAAEIRYHLGLCHLKAARPRQAAEEFRRTREAFPTTVWARYAGDRLKEMSSP